MEDIVERVLVKVIIIKASKQANKSFFFASKQTDEVLLSGNLTEV